MKPLRFLQISDVHFGQSMRGGKLRLPPESAAQRVRDRRDAFARALGLVASRSLDGVLLPGDLFDHEAVDTDTLRFVIHTLGSVSCPVFVAPGNHDPWAGASAWVREDAGNTRGLDWPANVHIFAHDDFRTVPWPGREDVSVTGCGVATDRPSDDRRLAGPIDRPGSECSLLLFHGSRDDSGFLQADKATAPFSSQELFAQEFRWTALGHYHQTQILDSPAGEPVAAYSGCLTAGGLDETGSKGALIVEIGEADTKVEFVGLDPRAIHEVECDLSGAGFREEAERRLLAALEPVPDTDLVRVLLKGRRAQGLDLGFLAEFGQDRWFHLAIDSSGLRPDLDLEQWPRESAATTIEEQFVARLRDAALSPDPGESIPARRALLYGLDALQRGRLDLRYED